MSDEPALDAPRVAEIVRAQFPDVGARAVSWLGAGYDSTAFEVDGKWVFRFPKRRAVERQLLLERRLLSVLAAQSPLPVPSFRFHGVPSGMFPRHFGGYRKLPGVPAIGVEPAALPFAELAPTLARFLSWLHAFPRDRAARMGVPEQSFSQLVDEARTDALGDFDDVARAVPDRPLEEWFQFLGDAPGVHGDSSARTVLVHGDFAAEHVLYDSSTESLTGVIDWSEVALGDPSVDLAGVCHWGGPRLMDAVLSGYRGPTDEIMRRRARYLAACRGVADVVFGLEMSRREYVEAGVHALTLAIPTEGDAVERVRRS